MRILITLTCLCVLSLSVWLATRETSDTQPQSLFEDDRSIQNTELLPAYTHQNDTHAPESLSRPAAGWEQHIKTLDPSAYPKPAPKKTSTQQTTRPVFSPSPATEEPHTPVATSLEPYKTPGFVEPIITKEDRIKAYGNTIGGIIQEAVSGMGNQNDILKQFVGDISATHGITTLEKKYRSLARSLRETAHEPGFDTHAAALAESYEEVANALAALTQTSDKTLYTSLLAYNASVETFAKAFVPFAELFGAYGVTFSPDEPGGMFTPAVSGF